MAVEIEEMTVDVEEARPEPMSPAPAPAVPVDTILRQVLAALTDYEALRQRLAAD
jgi:hypothetical protein